MRTPNHIAIFLAATVVAGCASTEGKTPGRKLRVGKRKRAHYYTVAGIESLMGEKRYTEALNVATHLIAEEQDKRTLVDARLLQGKALMHLGRYTDAVHVLDQVTQHRGGTAAIAWLWKGHCHYMDRKRSRKELPRAMECYAAAIRHPKADDQLRNEASIWMAQCKQASARAAQQDAGIQKAYERLRRLAEEYPELGWAKHLRGRISDSPGDFWRPEEKEKIMKGEQP